MNLLLSSIIKCFLEIGLSVYVDSFMGFDEQIKSEKTSGQREGLYKGKAVMA